MGDLDKYIKWFSELCNEDVAIAGGKGASLGEMYNAGFPVPPGFVITAQSFDYFITQSRLKEKIKAIIETIDMENTEELSRRSSEIRKLIENYEMPEDLKSEILEAYHILSSEKINKTGVSQNALSILKTAEEPVFVAVRSSATTEDLAEASFAGQQESFLNIKGDSKLIEYVKKCFSSLYTARAIYYRNKQGFGAADALLAVVIMKMIDSEKSGVIFSTSPVGSRKDITIEAVYGLGEGIVSGRIKPDNYLVSKDLKIQNISVVDKKIAIVRTGSGQNETVKLTPERSASQVLSNGQIIEAANYGVRLEEYYKKPQDIEFAIEANKFYIIQSRPITTLKKEIKKTGTLSGKILVEGLGSSPGIGVGVVKIINKMSDLPKIKKGDVLVTEMTNPDMVVAMQKSTAIVTDEGGLTSHASIVSREMAIPCVVGTGNATSILKEGMKVTVDGENGKVYEGEVAETHVAEIKPALKTQRVRLKLIVDLPQFAERASQSGIDAVGLLRIEGIIASSEKHPLLYEKENKTDEYCELLRKGIEEISRYFNLIWVRTSDIRTDEYSSLKGAPEKELNPMLGLHGIRFSLKHPKLFEAELLAIKKVAEKNSNKKFGVMFPQIISVDELKEAKKYFENHKTGNMDIGVMIETPAAVQVIESVCKEGIKFISFGTNDLTQFTLACDRGEEDVQYLYNEMHPSMMSQIRRVINMCRRYRIETSICGQAGSKKEMVKFLFKEGINSISVNADAAYDVSLLIKELEDKKMKEFEERKQAQQQRFEKRQEVQQKTVQQKQVPVQQPKAQMPQAQLQQPQPSQTQMPSQQHEPKFENPWEKNKQNQVHEKHVHVYEKPEEELYKEDKKISHLYKAAKYQDVKSENEIQSPSGLPLELIGEEGYEETPVLNLDESESSSEEEESEGLLNKKNIKIPAEIEISENEEFAPPEFEEEISEKKSVHGSYQRKSKEEINSSNQNKKNYYKYFDDDYK